MDNYMDFVAHQEALELKQLGFDEPCLAIYTHENPNYKSGTFLLHHPHPFTIEELEPIVQDIRENAVYILAPTYAQCFRWFREIHKLNGETPYLPNIEKYGVITSDMTIKPKDLSKNENLKRGVKVTNNFQKCDTHEEAELECLKRLIEIVKTYGGNK